MVLGAFLFQNELPTMTLGQLFFVFMGRIRQYDQLTTLHHYEDVGGVK